MAAFSEFCARRLVERGFPAYYAFATARDMLLLRKPRSINILTAADLFQLARLFPDIRFRRERREHAYLQHDGCAVHFYSGDFAADRSVSLPGLSDGNKDLLKRALQWEPFRVNSFFYSLADDVFYDPLDSYPVLKGRTIGTVKTPSQTTREFPSLALLTARAYSETGFEIEEELQAYLDRKADSFLFGDPDAETVANFIATITSKRAYQAVLLLDRWGVLEKLLPEVNRLKEVEQDKDHHPEGNAFRHTLHCLKFVKKPNPNLMMSILLHDTGKALTKSGESGRPFPNHAAESKKIARRVLDRFRLEEEDREEILFLVEHHMILNRVSTLPRTKRRELFSSPYFPNLLHLFRADIESGYHRASSYQHAARVYRSFLKEQKLVEQGIYP